MEGTPAKKRRLYGPEHVSIPIPSTSAEDQVEKKERLSLTQHGVAYQIKLLMLFFHRGAKQGYSYKLETELINSGKLDDVVYKYDKKNNPKRKHVHRSVPNDKVEDGVRYLQAKHSKIKTKTIQFNDLLKENDKLFGLSQYYLSFLEIVQSLKSEGKSTEFINQITLCTNIKFHKNLEECMDNISKVTKDDDAILYGNVVMNRYTFKKVKVKTEFTGKDKIVAKLSKVTEMCALANRFTKDLSKPEDSIKFKSMYQTYHGWLVKHIFELPEEFFEKANDPKYYVKFRETFIKIEEGKEREKLKAFRDKLLKAMAIDNETFVNRWRVKKIQTVEIFCCEANNNDTPKDLNKLATALAHSLSKNKKLTSHKLDESNHGWLLENVFYIPKPYVKIRSDLLDNTSNNNDVVAFRQLINVYLTKNKKGSKTLTAFRDKNIYVDKQFFENPKSYRTPDNSISDDLIETFLTKLVFVVTCDEESLGNAVQQELGNELSLIEDELIASNLEKRMYKFMKDETEYFVSNDTWDQFINKHINIIARYVAIGPTEKRKMKIGKYKCEFKKQEDQKSEKQEKEKTERTLDKIMTYADKRIMIIYQKYPLLTEIKIHQAFGCGERDAYIVDDLKDCINEFELQNTDDGTEPSRGLILKAFSSEKRSHLIIINDDVKICDKRKQFLKDVLDIVKNNIEKRFTLVTVKKDEDICKNFQLSGNYEILVDNDNFLDLTVATQNLLKKKDVIFQGRKTNLGTLIKDTKLKKYIKGEILFNLITDSEKIIIGDAPVHQSNLDAFKEIERFYIPRSLFRLIKIKDNIRWDLEQFYITTDGKIESNIDKRDIVLITQNVVENVFEELCRTSKKINTNIHWLVNYTNIGLVWQRTRGDLSKLHKYVDKHCKIHDSEVEGLKDNYTYQMNDATSSSENMIVVAADPGMGKSTLLTFTINETNKDTWVVRINLKDYQTHFSGLSKNNMEKQNAIKLLYKVLKFEVHEESGKEVNIFDFAYLEGDLICLDITDSLHIKISELKKFEIAIFNQFFNDQKVELFLDGFDEIDQNTTYWVAQINKMAKMKKIWLTTRPYDIHSILESELGVFSYQLNPVTQRCANEFLKKFWKSRLTQEPSESSENNIKKKEKYDVYVEELFKTYYSKQSDSTFIGVPLHIRMIAEIYEKEFKKFYESEDEYPTDPQKQQITKHTLFSLYKAFVDKKFYIRYKDLDRSLFNKRMVIAELKAIIEYHQKLSLTEILKDEDYKNLISEPDIDEIEITFEENDIGLVRFVENKVRFVHRTYAEYFTAVYLVDRLKRDKTIQNIDTYKVLSCIKDKINLDVRKFVNYYLIEEIDNDNRVLLNGVLNGDLNVLENKDLEGVHDSCGRNPLHLACFGPNLDNFKYVFDMYPAALNSKDTLFGWTPLHYAIAYHNKAQDINDSHLKLLKEAVNDVKYDVNHRDNFSETLLMLSIKNRMNDSFVNFLFSFDKIDLDCENKHHMTVLDYWFSDDNCKRDPDSLNCFYDGLFKLKHNTEDYLLKNADLCKGTIGKRLLNILDTSPTTQIRMMKTITRFRGEEYTKEWINVCIDYDNNFIVKLLSENLIVANLVLDIESRNIDVNIIDTVEKYTALKRAVEIEVNVSILCSDEKPRRDRVIFLLKAGAFYDDIEPTDWNNLWSKPDYFSKTIKDLINSIENNDTNETESILSNLDSNYIDKDVLVNIRDRKNGKTPLQFAAFLGFKDIVICLLKNGAFYNVLDEKRDIKTAEELTQNRDISDILAKTRKLFSAVKEGNIEKVIKYLDGNVNHKDKKGKQPIHLAIENGNLEIVKHLLNTDEIEPARAITLDESNVLHLAVKSGNNEILQTIFDRIDPEELNEIINNENVYLNTPLNIAKEQNNNAAAKALESKNAVVSTIAYHIYTPSVISLINSLFRRN